MKEMNSLTLNGQRYDSFVDAEARPLSNAAAIICSVSGEDLVLSDSSDYKMFGLHIFGKSTQDGVPTWEDPVDMVSVENPTVTINQVPLSVPYRLRGIPVKSDGNYTDANGQQWICDEVDLARGVYVQRVFEYVCTGNETWVVSQYQSMEDATRYDGQVSMKYNGVGGKKVLCTHFIGVDVGRVGVWVNDVPGTALNIRIQAKKTDFSSVEALVAFLKSEYANGTPVTYLCILGTPIETPLSAEELATYGTLYTTKPSTTLTVNSGAYMSVEYLADTKAYIDRIMGSAGSTSARILDATVE